MLKLVDKRKSDWYITPITYYNAPQLDVTYRKKSVYQRPIAVGAEKFKNTMSPGMFASLVMSLADAFYLGS